MSVRPISVIVCTHNRADLLPGVIGQLRAQDYPQDAFELVVVDNCSNDPTRHVVQQLAAEPGTPIRFIAEPRPGISFARNRGAEVASYPYLAYIDDDCSVEPDWLSQLVQGFDLHKHVVAVGGRVTLDWDQQEKPIWLEPELERWLAANGHLGTQPRLLEEKARVIECNMALTREAWRSSGGFLGMEQFGSKHMAAGEVLYLLNRITRKGGKVAYVPGAVVRHHVGRRTRRWMLGRAYWQGVSDGILDYFLYRRSTLSTIGQIALNSAAMIVLLASAVSSYPKMHNSKSMHHMLRAIRRLGLVLSQMRLVGDWTHARSWAAEHLA